MARAAEVQAASSAEVTCQSGACHPAPRKHGTGVNIYEALSFVIKKRFVFNEQMTQELFEVIKRQIIVCPRGKREEEKV